MKNPLAKFFTVKEEDGVREPMLDSVVDVKAPHEWSLVGRSYAPPIRNIPQQLTDIAALERAMFGVTTLLFVDLSTGELHREQMVGSDENQLQSLLEKAENYGIQYIPHNGKRFAIALVPSEEKISLN